MTSRQHPVPLCSVCYDDCEPLTVALEAAKPYCDGPTVWEEITTKLQDTQAANDVMEAVKIPTGYSAKDGTKYKALASPYEAQELIDKMEKQLAGCRFMYRSTRGREIQW